MSLLYVCAEPQGLDLRIGWAFKSAGIKFDYLTFFDNPILKPMAEFAESVINLDVPMSSTDSGAPSLIRHSSWETRASEKLEEFSKSFPGMKIPAAKYSGYFSCWGITSGYICFLANLSPLIYRSPGSDLNILPFTNHFYYSRAKRTLKHADLTICNSNSLVLRAKDIYHDCRAIRLNFLLDHGRFENFRCQKSASTFTFLVNRKFKPYYRNDLVVRASALLKKKNPSFKVLLFGDGVELESCKKLTADLGVEKQLEFAGNYSYASLLEVLSSADAYVSASGFDGMSLSTLEAMAAELPVILSDIPPNKEIFESHPSGELFKAGDEHSLAEKMEALLEHRGRYAEEASRNKTIAYHYSFQANKTKLVEHINRTIQKK